MKRNKRNSKILPNGFKIKNRQKYPRNVLYSYKNKDRKKRNYSYKDFSYSSSYNTDFSKCLFWGTKFTKATYRYSKFKNAKFNAITFYKCNFVGCNFNGAIFQDCLFKNCKFKKSKFEYTQMKNVFFSGCNGKPKCGQELPLKINENERKYLMDSIPDDLHILLIWDNLIILRQKYTIDQISNVIKLMKIKGIKNPTLGYLIKFI